MRLTWVSWLPCLKNNYIDYSNKTSLNNVNLNYIKSRYILCTNLTINNVLAYQIQILSELRLIIIIIYSQIF